MVKIFDFKNLNFKFHTNITKGCYMVELTGKWKVKNKDNVILNVDVKAFFHDTFNKKELEKIQSFYNSSKTKIDFAEKVKINGVYYKFRTKLSARWSLDNKNSKGKLGFIMFNPSFANPSKSDDTARNAIRFADKQGYNEIVIFNLFSIRISGAKFVQKYYADLSSNYKVDCIISDLPKDVVLCWGKLPEGMGNIDNVISKLCDDLKKHEKKLFQITDDEFQRHLSSQSINYKGGIRSLDLISVEHLYKFNSKS